MQHVQRTIPSMKRALQQHGLETIDLENGIAINFNGRHAYIAGITPDTQFVLVGYHMSIDAPDDAFFERFVNMHASYPGIKVFHQSNAGAHSFDMQMLIFAGDGIPFNAVLAALQLGFIICEAVTGA